MIPGGKNIPGARDLLLRSAALVFLALLFVGGPGDQTHRLLRLAWNQGHVLCFALWSYLLLTSWKRAAAWSWPRQAVATVLFAAAAGGLVELAQGLLGRIRDGGDVVLDVVGGLVALAFFAPSLRRMPRPVLWAVRGAVLAMVLAGFWPLSRTVADELVARRQFPVLADFESPFEIDRWGGSARFTVSPEVAAHGSASLRVRLGTQRYSGVYLRHFPGDWRGYRFLQLEVFNPSGQALTLHGRIHDGDHRGNGQKYRDRFNRSFAIDPGWNEIRIPLAEVEKGPRDRPMDMARIEGVGFFVAGLKQPAILFIDHLRLLD